MRSILFTAIVGCFVAGCGSSDGRIKVYPVHGKVLVNGQPAAGARVVFYPTTAATEGQKLPSPSGETDSAGDYMLQSFAPGDGAPVGDYQVTVVWLEPPPPNAQGIFDQRDRLAGRYATPEKSNLTARVEKGGGEIPPFSLK